MIGSPAPIMPGTPYHHYEPGVQPHHLPIAEPNCIKMSLPTGIQDRLHLLYLLIALIILGVGISGMGRVWSELGRPFGGFVWGWDFTSRSLTVAVETPWHWSGPRQGLQGGDRILAVEGHDAGAFSAVYRARAVGSTVDYRIARDDQTFTLSIPLRRFSAGHLFEFYGLIFLIGLSCLAAGYVLIRGSPDQPTVLLSFTLLALASALMYHGHQGMITRFYVNVPLLLLFFIPSYPLASACLIHLFFIFPRPLAMLPHRPWLVRLPYAGAVAVMLFHSLALFAGGLWDYVAIRLFFLAVPLGMLLNTVRALWSFFHPESERRGQAGALSVALVVGFVLMVGAGVLTLAGGISVLLTELIVPLSIVYPLILVYAVKNVELFQRLRGEETPAPQDTEAQAQDDGPATSANRPSHNNGVLTPRELDVLAVVAQGATDREAAQILTLSRHTVSTHLRNIYRKLEVHNRTAAVAEARERGFLMDGGENTGN